MRALTLLVALAGAAAATPTGAQGSRGEVRDIPWFAARPEILADTLARCERDARLSASWDCQNARRAASARRAQGLTTPARPSSAPPRGADGLPPPDYNPRTNPFGYQSLVRACAERGPGSEMFLPHCHLLDQYRGMAPNATR